MQKELALFDILSRHFPGGIREDQEKAQSG
jgi:hypothetical protein